MQNTDKKKSTWFLPKENHKEGQENSPGPH